MFRRLHLQLTGLCALITISILTLFTCLYLSVSGHNMKENYILSFQNRFDTLSGSLEQQSLLTYAYLLRMEQNNDCIIFLWDNGIPLSFNDVENHSPYSELADALFTAYCSKTAAEIPEHNFLFAYSREDIQLLMLPASRGQVPFPNTPSTEELCMGIGMIAPGMSTADRAAAIRKQQGLVLLVFSANFSLHSRFLKQRLTFALLSLAGCLLLTLFSYAFTGRMLRPLRETHEKQLAFVAGASHELRTPLAVILSAVSARPPHYEETIKTETLRMGRLVEELLSLSRLERENSSLSPFCRTRKEPSLLQPTLLEADTFLLDFYEQIENYVSSKGRHLALSLPAETLPALSADEEKLRQLLEILLENALSYTAEGGHIRLELRREKKALCFLVIDDGVGIPDAEKEKVFERFYRADSAHSSREHFGLGLCIAKEIMEAHRGHITVSDTPGGGCTFRCCFPISGTISSPHSFP